jgi:hypothetical protein
MMSTLCGTERSSTDHCAASVQTCRWGKEKLVHQGSLLSNG